LFLDENDICHKVYVLTGEMLDLRGRILKVVILAGGYGTRISEESYLKPKPMIEIGELPILWHIMKYYAHYGYTEFIICCGYKGYIIKEYFPIIICTAQT